MVTSELIICNTCQAIFSTEDEKENHAFKVHYKNAKGLTRAREWAELML